MGNIIGWLILYFIIFSIVTDATIAGVVLAVLVVGSLIIGAVSKGLEVERQATRDRVAKELIPQDEIISLRARQEGVLQGIADWRVSGNICPNCGRPLTARSGSRGLFIGCTGYPLCTYTKNI